MLTVITPATDPTLLTLAEVAEAVGGSSDTAALARLNARVGEMLAAACCLERAGVATLTLREETLSETVRLRCPVEVVYLSRKPVLEIISVTECDTALTVNDGFEQSSNWGLQRLYSGALSCWAAGKIVVAYRAGYPTVPNDLKELACKLAVSLWSEKGRDPSLGSVEIPNVIAKTYRFGRPDDPLVTSEILEGLRNGGYLAVQNMVG